MKKTALALISALLISSVVLGIKSVNLANANDVPIAVGFNSLTETTYSVNEILLIFSVTVYSYYKKEWDLDIETVEMFYSLEGNANVTVPISEYTKDELENEIYTAETVLLGLSDGSHKVTAGGKDQNGKVHYYWRYFTVDTQSRSEVETSSSPEPTPTPTPTSSPEIPELTPGSFCHHI